MKICPKCQLRYDDREINCRRDGALLISCNPEGKDSSSKKSVKQKAVRKRDSTKAKKLLLRICLMLIIAICVFCAGYYYYLNAATYLFADPKEVLLPKQGGQKSINVNHDGYTWEVMSSPTWLTVKAYDHLIVIQAYRNYEPLDREGSIFIKSGELVNRIDVCQYAKATYLIPSKKSIHFGKNGGSRTITLESDGYDYDFEHPDFISVSRSGSNITIEAKENWDEARSCYVYINEDNLRTSIHVTQGGKCNICKGKRVVTCSYCGGLGGFGYGFYYVKCKHCDGEGKVRCPNCDIRGYVK